MCLEIKIQETIATDVFKAENETNIVPMMYWEMQIQQVKYEWWIWKEECNKWDTATVFEGQKAVRNVQLMYLGVKRKKQAFIDAFTGEKMQQYDRNYILEEKMQKATFRGNIFNFRCNKFLWLMYLEAEMQQVTDGFRGENTASKIRKKYLKIMII